MKNFDDAARTLGTRDSRRLANNTYLERHGAAGIALRLHRTNILWFNPDGSVVYNSGGWRTVTTKARMNDYGPLRIWSDRGIWYAARVSDGWDRTKAVVYAEGMRYDSKHDRITGAARDAARENKLRAKVIAFCNTMLDRLEAGKLPQPSGGDCWGCAMVVKGGGDDGKPMGDIGFGQDHILKHVKERYYVPSLLANAVKERGAPVDHWALGAFWCESAEDRERGKRFYERRRIMRCLKPYVARRVGLVMRGA